MYLPILGLTVINAGVLHCLSRYSTTSFSHLSNRYVWIISVVLAWLMYTLDWMILYPRLRSHLRKLPTVKAANILGERPRGKTPLAWFHRYPDADVIHMHGLFGKQVLYPASPEALRDIFSTNSYHWAKPWGIRAFLARIIGFGLILSEGDAHRNQRKFLTPAFNIRNIRALSSLMWSKTSIFLDQLEKENEAQGSVEITYWASRLTLDIIGPAALSRDFQTMTSADDPIAHAFREILEPSPGLVTFMVSNMFLPQWLATRLPVRANEIIANQCSRVREQCRNILVEKRDNFKKLKAAEEGREDDILQHIMSTGQFGDEEIIEQMLTFLAAGHETTASALTWCTYVLAQRPDLQSRLREEIRNNISSMSTPVSSTALESMPLLNGVCEEVLRLYPTVPLTIREAQCDTTMAGIPIPKGVVALIVPYAINRHPSYWGENASDFVPERWIDTGKDGTQRANKHGGAHSNYCETTFLHGPRSCIGRDFAKTELRCAVAGIVGSFELELLEPEREVVIGGTVTTKPVGGLKLKLRRVPGW
ncbi:hypothetical protein LTR64_007432 [Lithohypha guttulata]|uniref:uncharacterized protein n=1 Tax=Lithohypha guttulata TaxID=1690604 RepID=UPI002DE18049|nr:hypothetical protein LTR51_006803 [Lithohypha guttulata]